METVIHPFLPVFDGRSKVLILGSFPSVKSRENHFYYGHPQNRFWKVAAALTKEAEPGSIPEKRQLLLRHGIALWDTIASCRIEGSSDSSIRDAVPNDIAGLLAKTGIRAVFCNGTASWELYRKYCEEDCRIAAKRLPSTSPANAAWRLERLTEAWREALSDYLL
ncbi:MAG: DNA-deoxyinosine glycosylase [Eubacteriales bacterium]|nr:DNA-deoxyinosine glycosylase [Eubacteriales bacterium]